MSLVTDAREALATALNTAGVTVYPIAPPTPVPPCLAITAGTPWQAPDTLTGRRVNWRILAAVQGRADQLPNLEQLVEDAISALPGGVYLDSVSAPANLSTGAQGSVLAVDIDVHARLTE